MSDTLPEVSASPALSGDFEADCQQLLQCDTTARCHPLREQFCQLHGEALAQQILANASHWRSMSQISDEVAKRVPQLVPTQAQINQAANKQPLEALQGILFSHWLSHPRAGKWLLDAQRLPSPKPSNY